MLEPLTRMLDFFSFFVFGQYDTALIRGSCYSRDSYLYGHSGNARSGICSKDVVGQ